MTKKATATKATPAKVAGNKSKARKNLLAKMKAAGNKDDKDVKAPKAPKKAEPKASGVLAFKSVSKDSVGYVQGIKVIKDALAGKAPAKGLLERERQIGTQTFRIRAVLRENFSKEEILKFVFGG